MSEWCMGMRGSHAYLTKYIPLKGRHHVYADDRSIQYDLSGNSLA